MLLARKTGRYSPPGWKLLRSVLLPDRSNRGLVWVDDTRPPARSTDVSMSTSVSLAPTSCCGGFIGRLLVATEAGKRNWA